MTAMLSVDAFQLSVTPVEVRFEASSPVGVDGGVVSPVGGGGGGVGVGEHALVETLRCACADAFPAASRAATPNE